MIEKLSWEGFQSTIRGQESTIATLPLALRTIVAAPSGDHDALNGRLADETGLAFAAVDAVLQLKEACFAVGVNVVRDGGAAQSNRLLENFFH
jgi:hypothetical protein